MKLISNRSLPKFPLLLLGGLGLLAPPALAGTSGPADTLYLNGEGKAVAARSGAARWQVNEKTPAGGLRRQVFDGKGALLETLNFSDPAATIRQGEALYWAPDHSLRRRERYVANQLTGQQLTYYPDGTIQELTVYANNAVTYKQAFAADGTAEEAIKSKERAARYGASSYALDAELKFGTVYPANGGGKKGMVLVRCLISSTGQLTSTTVMRSMGPGFDEEALRVARSLRRGWKPAIQDGTAVESEYILQVDFLPPQG